MKNKKLLGFLLGLLSIVLSVSLVLVACDSGEDKEKTTETVGEQNADPTKGESTAPNVTEPKETEPEATQPNATEPEETIPEETEPDASEPEETQPEATEPVATQPSGPSVNTGTGGGYDPGTSDPTEPATPTEPEIIVPAAGTENNAYTEQLKSAAGSFTTVKIPAGQNIYYRIKTPGAFLRIEDAEVSVVYNGTTYEPVEGVVEITLPEDDSQVIALQLINRGEEEKSFGVTLKDAIGSQTNPIVLHTLSNVETDLPEGNETGVYYTWIADQSGVLNIALEDAEGAEDVADAMITVGGKTVRLSENGGQAQISVSAGDEVSLQVLTNDPHPAAKIRLSGYVAVIVDLTVSEIPADVETVTVPGKQSVLYRISGIRGKILMIRDSDFSVLFDGTVYSADESGVITISIPAGTTKVELELMNDSEEEKATVFRFNYSLGHEQNPHVLTELGELETATSSDQNGYYYNYTATETGVVTFQIWVAPEQPDAKTDIALTNATTGESNTLWVTDEAGEPVQGDTVSVNMKKGDQLTIRVSVTNKLGRNINANLVIYGELYGSEELPIQVAYPGFTANVPAGETLYYEGYNMGGLILSMTGENGTISHNGTTYEGSPISFTVVADGRNPAVFAIRNTGTNDAVYQITFTYPVGHSENPAKLALGSNVLTQETGATDYYYTFTAPRAGKLTLTFDSSAQWLYAVDNLTQGTYGDTQWSDSDPQVAETTISVKINDVIVVRVNTYDAANMFETPAGTVTFIAKFVSGPTKINNLNGATNTNLTPGEYAAYTGQFYDYVLSIKGGEKLVVYFDGTAYYPDATGEIKVEFPASDGSGSQPDLEYMVHNTDTANVVRSMTFSTMQQGSIENPAPLQYGPNVMVQTQNNGADYYYTFTVTANGRFTVTFEAEGNWLYQLRNLTRNMNSGIQLSSMGRNTYTMTVRKGDVIQLMVNTFDPATGGSPEGTVEFTVVPA